jgi:hypothetical protein
MIQTVLVNDQRKELSQQGTIAERRFILIRTGRVIFPTKTAGVPVLIDALSQGQLLLSRNQECSSTFKLVQTALR